VVAGEGNAQLTNDANYIASGDNVSTLTNDANYIASGDNVSTLTNDANYVASGDNVSTLTNDAGYLTAVTSANITNDEIVDADINASAAIAGTKINPNFGTQNISTTGTLSSGATDVTSLRVTSLGDGAVTVINGDGTITSSSDKRLKENIQLLQNTLVKLSEIESYSYNYIADENKKKQLGVIAQELEVVFPELVITDERGFKSVNYQGLIPVLMQAIKEQQAEIASMNQRLKSQEKRLTELASDNQGMKSDLELLKEIVLGTKTAKE
jgi:hypothetical protein